MENRAHKNSRVITINRRPLFSHENQKEVADYLSGSKREVGPYFKHSRLNKSGTGLSLKEEELLMPKLIDVDKLDLTFRKSVAAYFDMLYTNIPVAGCKLEVGLETNNDLPVSDENLPLDVEGFVRWRHALGNPKVAPTKEEGLQNPLYWFYVSDPNRNLKDAVITNDQKDRAIREYLAIANKEDAMKRVLVLMGVDVRLVNASEYPVKLRELAEKQPVEFFRVCTDKKATLKYKLKGFITEAVLKSVGTRYLMGDTTIGNTEEEAVLWLEDPANSSDLKILDSQYYHKTKNKDSAQAD